MDITRHEIRRLAVPFKATNDNLIHHFTFGQVSGIDVHKKDDVYLLVKNDHFLTRWYLLTGDQFHAYRQFREGGGIWAGSKRC